MAETSERRMNLKALQRVDYNITDIIYNASQAALYKFNPKSSEWEKTEIEGTFFIYTRTLVPHHGFIVMNRLSTTNLIEPITAGLEFQLQTPFLLYKNATGQIFGIWFYDESECISIEDILNKLSHSGSNNQLNVQASQRQRCASEGDKMYKGNSGNKSKGSLDILSLLCQAQEEYDKQQKTSKQSNVKMEPKTIRENLPRQSTPKEIVKPTPLRLTNGSNIIEEDNLNKSQSNVASTSNSSNKGTALSLAALFAQANASEQQAQVTSVPPPLHISANLKNEPFSTSVKSAPIKIGVTKPPSELQRLFSNPANTVEHIEKQQLNENIPARDRSTSFSGHTAPLNTTNDSLEKDLRQRLNLNPSNLTPLVLNPMPSSNESGHNDIFAPHFLGRRHSVSPALNTITPAALLASSKKPLISSDIEGPIITPAMFQQSNDLSPLNSPFFPDRERSFRMSPLNTSNTLCPLNFTKSLTSFSQPLQTQVSKSDNDSHASDALALTKEHLKESLVYLLQNDDDFLTKVHDGYIASLKSQLGKFRFKPTNT